MAIPKQLPQISRPEIERVLALRAHVQALRRNLHRTQVLLEESELQAIGLIEAGAFPACPGYRLSVAEEQRRIVAWKERFIDFAGRSVAEEIIAATEPRVFTKLIIEQAA